MTTSILFGLGVLLLAGWLFWALRASLAFVAIVIYGAIYETVARLGRSLMVPLLGLLLLLSPWIPLPSFQSGPAPVSVEIPTPSLPMQDAVAGVTELVGGPDAVRLAVFYQQLAALIERDTAVIQTTSQVRELNRRAGRLLFGADLAGKYPGLGEELNEITATQLGLEHVALDETKRRETVALFEAIAWACWEAR